MNNTILKFVPFWCLDLKKFTKLIDINRIRGGFRHGHCGRFTLVCERAA